MTHIILRVLEEKGPQRNGFYKTTVGKEPDKVYGLVQCTGDVSAQNCSQCIKDAAHSAFGPMCNTTKYFAIWYRWCYVRFADTKDFWETDYVIMSTSHGNGSDKLSVVSAGINLIHKLAYDAPNQPRFFKTDTVDVGRQGRRYGLAQCDGDLGNDKCRKCLTAKAEAFDQFIGNASSLVVSSHGCSIWYDDYQFYFKYTIPTEGYPYDPDTGDALPSIAQIGITTFITAVVTSLQLFFIF
ncbi:hypothetical protein QQ045_015664 [Rhodiola kirilowii]